MIAHTTTAPDLLKLLAHDLRWQLLAALTHSDRRVQELAKLVNRPMNLVSYHLRQLREAGLVREQRSSADGRDLYYSLDLDELARRYRLGGAMLHPRLMQTVCELTPVTSPVRVLFLCTRNSARSQMAEGLLRARAGTRPITVASAGSRPAAVDPDAVAALAALGIDIATQRPKHLDEFQGQTFDQVITVCDQVREECPIFPGDPDLRHWSIPDPAAFAGSATERRAVFAATAQALARRMDHLLMTLDAADLTQSLPRGATRGRQAAKKRKREG